MGKTKQRLSVEIQVDKAFVQEAFLDTQHPPYLSLLTPPSLPFLSFFRACFGSHQRVDSLENMLSRIGTFGLLLALGLFAQLASAQDPGVSIPGVIDVTPDNMKQVFNGMKLTMAEFYAPWCGHCKRLVPEYTKLAEMVAEDPMMSQFVQIAKADCDAHREIGEPFGVTGFPTLKILSRGIGIEEAETAFNYDGPRDAETMFARLKDYVEKDNLVGRQDDLDVAAGAFMAETKDKETMLDVVKELTTTHPEGDVHYKVMEKIIKKGDGYPEKEKARIARIIQKGSITRTKFAEMVVKQNVLDAFIEGAAKAELKKK